MIDTILCYNKYHALTAVAYYDRSVLTCWYCVFFQNQSQRGYGAGDEAFLEADDQESFFHADEDDIGAADWDGASKRYVSR